MKLKLFKLLPLPETGRAGYQVHRDADLATACAAGARWHVDVEAQPAPQHRVSAHARADERGFHASSQAPCDPALRARRGGIVADARPHFHAEPRRPNETQCQCPLHQIATFRYLIRRLKRALSILHAELEAAAPQTAGTSQGGPADLRHATRFTASSEVLYQTGSRAAEGALCGERAGSEHAQCGEGREPEGARAHWLSASTATSLPAWM